jgi:citrate lyase gamma subunit
VFQTPFPLTLFKKDFSRKIQTEVLQTLNTKVVKQVTLYKNAKGSWVV